MAINGPVLTQDFLNYSFLQRVDRGQSRKAQISCEPIYVLRLKFIDKNRGPKPALVKQKIFSETN